MQHDHPGATGFYVKKPGTINEIDSLKAKPDKYPVCENLKRCSALEGVASYADVAVWWIKGLVTKSPLKIAAM
jgi:hypothetical protein